MPVQDSAVSVIPFSPTDKGNGSNRPDQLDSAGKSILQLLQKAAGVAEDNTRHALRTAEKLAHQLRAATDRIVELEDKVAIHSDRADRAEQWLHTIYTEIEERFRQQERRTKIVG
jgi:regulator of sigma D